MNQITSEDKSDYSENISEDIYTVKNLAAKNRKNGTWPDTDAAIWALRAGSPANGIPKNIFLKIGRRVLVNEKRLWAAISKLQETKNASGK